MCGLYCTEAGSLRSIVRKIKEQGLSLKVSSILMLIVSIGITVILVIFSVRAFISFKALEDSTGIYIEIEERASTLMDASDYLTEQVQCYTVIGKRVYLDNYFTTLVVVTLPSLKRVTTMFTPSNGRSLSRPWTL